MNPSSYQDNRSLEFQRSFFVREDTPIIELLMFLSHIIFQPVGDGEQVNISLLWRLDQYFPVVVNPLIFSTIFQTIKVANILFILVGIAESELNTLMILLEDKLDGALDFSVLV